MAQSIDEQITTIERALGERMIEHALIIVRAWLNELGENNPYEESFNTLRTQYGAQFTNWLTSDDPDREATLDALTGDAYRLVDEVYKAIRIKRGISPDVRGFNGENAQSVMHYFSSCLRFTDADFQWLQNVSNDPSHAAVALMAVSAMAKNVRDCFSEQVMMALIEGMNSENNVVAEQCLANILILLAHFDVRIDFFPDIQTAFTQAVEAMDDGGEQAFQTLCALVRSIRRNWGDRPSAEAEIALSDLPQELQNLLELTGTKDDMSTVMAWLPESEQEYMEGIVEMLPDTWVYSALVGDSAERISHIAIIYLSVGRMDLLWDHTDTAARWLLHNLRKGSKSPLDYINYGHCLLLQGDRVMAFENYHQARQLCKSSKEFFNLFRPDRRQLVDRGIPVETVYLIEDQLINN